MTPTIGRRVWYWPDENERKLGVSSDGVQPCDAGVIYVFGANMVNLLVTDHVGQQHIRKSVYLAAPDAERPISSHATWMPYQVNQARAQAQEADNKDFAQAVRDAVVRGNTFQESQPDAAGAVAGGAALEQGVTHVIPPGVYTAEDAVLNLKRVDLNTEQPDKLASNAQAETEQPGFFKRLMGG